MASDAANLVADDEENCVNSEGYPDNRDDVYVSDGAARTIERVSIGSRGQEGDDDSHGAAMSADGRFLAFSSGPSNLVAGDTNRREDVFVRDRIAGSTTRVSVSALGAQANGDSSRPVISPDGRFVFFLSSASNLVAGSEVDAAAPRPPGSRRGSSRR